MPLPAMNVGLTEMEAILATFARCEVTLRMADTRLIDTERIFHRWDFPLRIPVEWIGRGGTDLAGAIKQIADSRKFKGIVVVSDMRWHAAPSKNPGVPGLGGTTENIKHLPPYSTPSFGQVEGPR